MTDVSFAMQAKSDQLNSADIMGCEPVITIRAVNVHQGEQPISVYYHGDNNRPWKPSKGMVRILAAAWGTNSENWVGKSAQIYMDPSVTYGGQAVGGIRIKALSDIDKRGLNCTLAISRQKRQPYPVAWLDMSRPAYPEDQFAAALPKMEESLKSGKATLEKIVAYCQKTGDLSPDQLQRLEAVAPIHAEEGDDEAVTGTEAQ